MTETTITRPQICDKLGEYQALADQYSRFRSRLIDAARELPDDADAVREWTKFLLRIDELTKQIGALVELVEGIEDEYRQERLDAGLPYYGEDE